MVVWADVSCFLGLFIAIGVAILGMLALAIGIRRSPKFESWGKIWHNARNNELRIHPILKAPFRIGMSIWGVIQLVKSNFILAFVAPSTTAWSESPPNLKNCLPLFATALSFVQGTVDSKALYSFASSLHYGSFSLVRLCTNSPPSAVDAYFASSITTDRYCVGDESICKYGADRNCSSLFCEWKDCLPLSRCTMQQIAESCHVSSVSNYSNSCLHLLNETLPLPNGFLWNSVVSFVPDTGCGLIFSVNNNLPKCQYNYVYTLTAHASSAPLIAVSVFALFISLQAIIGICSMASSDPSVKAWVMETRGVGDVFTLYVFARCLFKGEAIPVSPPHQLGQKMLFVTDLLEVIVIPWYYISTCPVCSYSHDAHFVIFKIFKILIDFGSSGKSRSNKIAPSSPTEPSVTNADPSIVTNSGSPTVTNSSSSVGTNSIPATGWARFCCCLIFVVAIVAIGIFHEQVAFVLGLGSSGTSSNSSSSSIG